MYLSEVTRDRHPILFVLSATRNSGLSYLWYLSNPEPHRYSRPWSVYIYRHRFDETSDHTTGAIDSGVVNNISNIEWHYVVPFAPEGASNNVSSYLHWALELSSISVGRIVAKL